MFPLAHGLVIYHNSKIAGKGGLALVISSLIWVLKNKDVDCQDMEAYKDLNFVIYLRFLAKLFQSQAWVDAESWIYMWKATS